MAGDGHGMCNGQLATEEFYADGTASRRRPPVERDRADSCGSCRMERSGSGTQKSLALLTDG